MPTSTWVGTNDTGATWLDPTGGGAFLPLPPGEGRREGGLRGNGGNNLVMVASNEYDNGTAGGDGNLTAMNQYVDASTVRTTQMAFDWRDRAVQTTAAQDLYSITTLDNMSRAIQNAQYAQATGNLIRLQKSLYDDRSRVYQILRYGVDPATGAIGNYLINNTWYDGTGNVIMSLPAGSAAFTKSLIDGAGRSTVQYVGYYTSGSGSSSSSSAGNGVPSGPVAFRVGWALPTISLSLRERAGVRAVPQPTTIPLTPKLSTSLAPSSSSKPKLPSTTPATPFKPPSASAFTTPPALAR